MPGPINSQLGYVNLGVPNVGLLPPLAVPTPSVSNNTGFTNIPTQFTTLDKVMPFHLLRDVNAISWGDVGPGVVSGMMFGPSRPLFGSARVLMGGSPVTSFGVPQAENGAAAFNDPGFVITPTPNRVITLT